MLKILKHTFLHYISQLTSADPNMVKLDPVSCDAQIRTTWQAICTQLNKKG